MNKQTAWRDSITDEHRERINAKGRARHRAVGFTAQAKWEKLNAQKRAAYAAVKHARKMGRLTPEPCLFCDKTKVEAHHHSYAPTDRLNVTWLCRQHHRRAHRLIP